MASAQFTEAERAVIRTYLVTYPITNNECEQYMERIPNPPDRRSYGCTVVKRNIGFFFSNELPELIKRYFDSLLRPFIDEIIRRGNGMPDSQVNSYYLEPNTPKIWKGFYFSYNEGCFNTRGQTVFTPDQVIQMLLSKQISMTAHFGYTSGSHEGGSRWNYENSCAFSYGGDG